MNKQETEHIVRDYLESEWKNVEQIEIMLDKTIEKDYGWIFLYQSKRFVQTGNLQDMLIGNCPVLVTRSGQRILFPTSIPVLESIKRYEAGLPLLPTSKREG